MKRATTYKWESAVATDSNLGLVSVDENARVTGWATAAVTCHNAVVSPADGLFVDEFDGGIGLGLRAKTSLC